MFYPRVLTIFLNCTFWIYLQFFFFLTNIKSAKVNIHVQISLHTWRKHLLDESLASEILGQGSVNLKCG